jgi:hypothetical protein
MPWKHVISAGWPVIGLLALWTATNYVHRNRHKGNKQQERRFFWGRAAMVGAGLLLLAWLVALGHKTIPYPMSNGE